MNPELLTCRRLTAGILYPPQQLTTVDLNHLYATITERYPYQSLQHLPDGVRMANPQNDLFVQQTRMQVNEEVMFFPAVKEKCLDVFELVSDKLGISQFLTFGVKLTATVQMATQNAASEFMEARAFAIRPEQWDILGEGRKGAGMRVVLHQDGIHDLRIEPFYNDTSQLYVELDVQHPQQFSEVRWVEPRIDAAYTFMFENVKEFLGSM